MVVVGAGAAGIACTDIMLAQGVGDVIVCNRSGAIYAGEEGLDADRAALAERTNPRGVRGTADEVLAGADVLIGLSGPGAVTAAGVRAMAPNAIVFAMANPVPEVQPEEVRDDVAVMATGRSDYPNQINNVLAFPGVFKGALDVRARTINEEMKLAAAHAIASVDPGGRAAPRVHHPERLQPPGRRAGGRRGRQRRGRQRRRAAQPRRRGRARDAARGASLATERVLEKKSQNSGAAWKPAGLLPPLGYLWCTPASMPNWNTAPPGPLPVAGQRRVVERGRAIAPNWSASRPNVCRWARRNGTRTRDVRISTGFSGSSVSPVPSRMWSSRVPTLTYVGTGLSGVSCASSSPPAEYATAASRFERSTLRRAVKFAPLEKPRVDAVAVDGSRAPTSAMIASTKPTSSPASAKSSG